MKPIFTPNFSDTPLCITCKRSVVVEGKQYKERITYCNMLERNVNFDVTNCSKYIHANEPSLYDMQKIAWPLLTDKKGTKIGFKSPEETRRLISSDKVDPSEYPEQYD